jgi:hypothetical protein
MDCNRLGLQIMKSCQLYLQQCQVVGMQEKISVSCHSITAAKTFFDEGPIRLPGRLLPTGGNDQYICESFVCK